MLVMDDLSYSFIELVSSNHVKAIELKVSCCVWPHIPLDLKFMCLCVMS